MNFVVKTEKILKLENTGYWEQTCIWITMQPQLSVLQSTMGAQSRLGKVYYRRQNQKQFMKKESKWQTLPVQQTTEKWTGAMGISNGFV